ncbi:hypothetical protein ACLOJK_041038 [Asimina triloba]
MVDTVAMTAHQCKRRRPSASHCCDRAMPTPTLPTRASGAVLASEQRGSRSSLLGQAVRLSLMAATMEAVGTGDRRRQWSRVDGGHAMGGLDRSIQVPAGGHDGRSGLWKNGRPDGVRMTSLPATKGASSPRVLAAMSACGLDRFGMGNSPSVGLDGVKVVFVVDGEVMLSLAASSTGYRRRTGRLVASFCGGPTHRLDPTMEVTGGSHGCRLQC